jgi:threonylcarbamoyladenosine tRNA methylthiotransferase MtaB
MQTDKLVSNPDPLCDTLCDRVQKRVGIATLGCKVNTFESEMVAQSLKRSGWSVVGDKETADLFIINTCTVTREADRQARQAVRRVIRRNPDAVVVVTGCYAQISPESCAAIPGVDYVVGNDRKLEIDKLLPGLRKTFSPRVMVGDLNEHVSLPDQLLTGYDGQTRAFVQIQQGCNQGCTFCIIHRARGPSRSLLPTMVKRQVERLAIAGYREIVICGVDLGAYGEDFSSAGERGYKLTDLLLELCEIEQDFRLRLSSIDPAHIDEKLMDLLSENVRMCPQLHLSLQSGSTLILKRMKRRYDAGQVYQKVRALRAMIPGLVLSADIMVGFPTENEARFRESLTMITELEIAYPHVFPYSERSGTPASRIPASKQVPVAERRARAAILRDAGRKVRHDLLGSRIGIRSRVLVEGGRCPLEGYQKARAADYIESWVPVPESDVGEWADVVYESALGDALIARLAG